MYLFRKYLFPGCRRQRLYGATNRSELSAHPPGGKPDYYGRNGPDQGPIPKAEQTHSKTPYTACQITISECQRVPESATPCKTEQSRNQYYTFKTNSFKPSNKFQLWQSKRTKTIHRNRLRFIPILTKKPCSSVIPKTGKVGSGKRHENGAREGASGNHQPTLKKNQPLSTNAKTAISSPISWLISEHKQPIQNVPEFSSYLSDL